MNVSQSEAMDFMAKNHRAVLATIRSNGMPQLTNVAQALIGGRIHVSTQGTSAKVRNIRSDPRVTVSILSDESWYKYAVVYGTVEIVEQPAAGPLLRTVYKAIAGPHPNWEEYDQAMIDEQRVVLRIAIDKIVT